MAKQLDLDAVATITRTAFVAIAFGATAILALRRHHESKRSGRGTIATLYHDQDGEATEKSMADYSNRFAIAAASLSILIGIAAAIANLILPDEPSTLSHHDELRGHTATRWLDILVWVVTACQLAQIIRYSSKRGQHSWIYLQALCCLVSAIALTGDLVIRNRGNDLLDAPYGSLKMKQAVCWLLQIASACLLCFAAGLIKRRPDVFFKNTVVDQQYTVSLMSKLTFAWNASIFHISKKRQLEMTDLPQLDFVSRSRNLFDHFVEAKGTGRLWWRLLKFYRVQLAQQWILVLFDSMLALFPQYMLFNLLTRLEEQGHEADSKGTVAAWALALCLSLILENVVGTLLSWWTNSRLVMPVSATLQSLVFHKALHEHEIAAPPQKPEDESPTDGKEDGRTANPATQSTKRDQVRQSVINHMKIDSGRVGMFCSYNFYLPMAVVKLFLAGGALILLLGWKAVLAGFAAAVCTVPFNSWVSKKYGKIQFSLMKYRDGKANLLTEALQGMRQIKFSALEDHWEKKILASRDKELAQYFKATLFMAATMLALNLGPVLLASIAQTVYALEQGDNVKASVIFASLGLFDQADEAVALLPLLQVYMQEAWTSCTRLENYLNQPDKTPVAVPADTVAFENATIAWPKKGDTESDAAETAELRSQLRDINLEFPSGKLSLISGKTGSGKSLLLAGILGEVTLFSGTVKVPEPPREAETESGKLVTPSDWIIPTLTSFVSQSPWIETGTVRENITFGCPFDELRYSKVSKACSLEQDFELLADGDETEVGPKGVTLSGGQKWRVALARSLYSRAGILVLDDVLSAVDAHVGRCIVDEALSGELAEGRTRILATHHAEMCLPYASYLVTLRDGRVAKAQSITPTAAETKSLSSGTASVHGSDADGEGAGSQTSEHTFIAATARPRDTRHKKTAAEDEAREKGRVKWKIYRAYLQAANAPALWALVFLLIAAGGVTSVGRVWSFKEFAQSGEQAKLTTLSAHHLLASSHDTQLLLMHPIIRPAVTAATSQKHSAVFWVAMSVAFYVLSLLLQVTRAIIMTMIGLRASRLLFERMTHAILRVPLRWLDTIPSGRILNRFTSDTFLMDRRLPGDLGSFISSVFQLFVTMAASVSVSIYVIISGIVLIGVYVQIALRYISAARELKRLNSISHSPIYDQFGSVLQGLSTIRAFNRTNFYMNRMLDLIDNSTRATWNLALCGKWMMFRLSLVGTIFVTSVALAVSFNRVDAALAGFSLTFALRYSIRLTGLLSSMTSAELSFNAAERVVEYANLETESEKGIDAPASWPAEGEIEVENITVAYKPNLPPVLKNISFTVKPGERVGIVGRTGAGKSTLASVFFRLLDPREGSVRIDNIDIATLKLKDLRSRLAIIPQDPFLFSGTLRSNLDIESTKDDYELQTTLQRVKLAQAPSERSVRPSQYQQPAAATQIVISTSDEAPEAPIDSVGEQTIDEASEAQPLLVAPATTIVESPAPAITSAEADSRDIFNNLSMEISTGGANLSQGQRQLVCLARSLLARPNIVIMDEATSAVDRATDAAIQSSLRDEFAASGCTVLVIAHRLSTVADFDKILVLEAGEVAEFGSPRDLLERGMSLSETKSVVEDDGQKGTGEGGGVGNRGEGKAAKPNGDGGSGPVVGTRPGALWDLIQDSSEKDVLIRMILGGNVSL